MELARIIGCISIYNEAEFIERCLVNTLAICDEVIIVDGPYADFPHDSCHSTDGTLATICKYMDGQSKPITLVSRGIAWPNQYTKRNAYVKLVDAGDLMLIIDGDQVPLLLTGAKDRILASDANGFQPTKILQYGGGVLNLQQGNPRIIRKFAGLHYDLNHYSLWDSEGRNICFSPYRLEPLWDCFKIVDYGNFRKPEKLKAREEFYKNRVELSNGSEHLVCDGCQTEFDPKKGEVVRCPKCGRNGGSAKPAFI